MSAIVVALANSVVILWQISASFMAFPPLRISIVRAFFWELRPFFLPAAVLNCIFNLGGDGYTAGGWSVFWLGVQFFNWAMLKDPTDDDDRWKRRRQKLAERVERQGAKLVAVPAGGAR